MNKTNPTSGGSYVRDSKTGELRQVQKPTADAPYKSEARKASAPKPPKREPAQE